MALTWSAWPHHLLTLNLVGLTSSPGGSDLVGLTSSPGGSEPGRPDLITWWLWTWSSWSHHLLTLNLVGLTSPPADSEPGGPALITQSWPPCCTFRPSWQRWFPRDTTGPRQVSYLTGPDLCSRSNSLQEEGWEARGGRAEQSRQHNQMSTKAQSAVSLTLLNAQGIAETSRTFQTSRQLTILSVVGRSKSQVHLAK